MKNIIKLIRKHPIASITSVAILIFFAIPIIWAITVSLCVIIPIYFISKIFGIK